jgi:N-ethylmaleimide reductase
MTSVPFIGNTGFDKTRGMEMIAAGKLDAVAYGVLYLANPDLIARFETDAGLNEAGP